MSSFSRRPFLQVATLAVVICGSARAAEDLPAGRQDDLSEREARFQQTLSGVVLEGHFTIIGADEPGPLRRETYTIQSVQKLPEGDFWLFQARIQYGGRDVTLPLPLEVKWAGDTPVITLTRLTIPGLGTYSARVVIDGENGKYAGTWSHDDRGGHMFGVIKPADPAERQ